MNQQVNDKGILTVLAKRLVEQRLPRLERLKEQLDRGEVLTDYDLTFMKQVLEDAQANQALVDRHPEVQKIVGQIIHLYKEIMDKAFENENTKN
ncbi:MAG: hypothetical protein WCG35_11415 [Betaproteobacteria bacterium]